MRQSTHCKYINYIKHCLGYSKTIGKIEAAHVLDFVINSGKCAIATIIYISPFESLNKYPPLINKYMTGIFNLRPPNPQLSFVWDVDNLFRYFEHYNPTATAWGS